MDLGRDGMGDGGLLGVLAGVWRGRGAASRTDGAWSFMVATSVGWMTYTEAAELLLCPGPRSTGRQPIPAPQAAGRGQPSMMRTRARPFRISAWGFPRESRETVTRGLFVGERRGVPGGVVAGRKEPGAQQLCELPRLEIAVRRHSGNASSCRIRPRRRRRDRSERERGGRPRDVPLLRPAEPPDSRPSG